MKVIVTCGPSYEPIDEVRRLTNFSTGQLGVLLANRLARAGHEVVCLKGIGATCEERLAPAVIHTPFTTNADLLARLQTLSVAGGADAIFHAAALCDYRIKEVRASDGGLIAGSKIPSRSGELTLTLEPTRKIIGELRRLFPRSRIVGWKYELEGTRDNVFAAATRQISSNETDACVVNGAAFGVGFGVWEKGGLAAEPPDKPALCEWLAGWIGGVIAPISEP